MVDVLGRRSAERAASARVQRLVRPMVVAADYVRDPEVGVVDDAREVVGGGAVVTEQRHALGTRCGSPAAASR